MRLRIACKAMASAAIGMREELPWHNSDKIGDTLTKVH